MDSFGARFSEDKYIKVDVDFSTGTYEVTIITEQEETPVPITGGNQME